MKPKNLPEMWHDLPAYMRLEQITKSNEKDMLYWIAKNDKDSTVKIAVIDKLELQFQNDVGIVSWMATSEKDISVRIAAINKLHPEKSKQVLLKLTRDKLRQIRYAARKKLHLNPEDGISGDGQTRTECVKCGKENKGKTAKFFFGTSNPSKSSRETVHMGAVVKTYTTSIYDILGFKEGFVCNICVQKKYFLKIGLWLFSLTLGIIMLNQGKGPFFSRTISILDFLGILIIGATLYTGYRSDISPRQIRDNLLISEFGKELEQESQKSLHFFTRSQHMSNKK